MADALATPPIEQSDLVAPVRRLLGTDAAEIVEWSTAALSYQDFADGTRALRRASGTARTTSEGDPVGWSMVLKAFLLKPAGSMGTVDPGAYDSQAREPRLYASRLLDEHPEGFRAPRCYGVSSLPGFEAIWMEDVQESHPGLWSLDRFELAARHLGRFNAWWAGRSMPTHWLCDLGAVAEYWTTDSRTQPAITALLDPADWRATTQRAGLSPTPEPTALRTLVADRDPVLRILRGMPQTLCHNDATRANLFAHQTSGGADETVAIDWQLAGLGPHGADIAMLVAGSALFLATDPGALGELDERALRGYVMGLEDAGASVDVDEVRLAYAAATVLRMTAIVATWVGELADPDGRADAAAFWRHPADELARQWAPLVGFLEAKAGIVRRAVAPGGA